MANPRHYRTLGPAQKDDLQADVASAMIDPSRTLQAAMAKQARLAHALIMARNALVFALSLLTFVGLAGAASADERHLHGDLLCDGKAAIAVVRFTISFNEERPVYRRLPVAVDGGLSADSGSDRTDCRLPDGKTVRLRIGVEQVFPYGLGGREPAELFQSLDRQAQSAVEARVEGGIRARPANPCRPGHSFRAADVL
jgi:hypothetical protein